MSWTCSPSAPSPVPPARSGRPPNSPRPSATCSPSSRSRTRRRSSRPPPQPPDQRKPFRLVTRPVTSPERIRLAQATNPGTMPDHICGTQDAVPGADLDAPVMVGVGHDQQLVRRTQVPAGGELEALAVHAVAAGAGFARPGPPVVEDPLAGDAHQQLDLEAAQRVR